MVGIGKLVMSLPLSSGLLLIESSLDGWVGWMTNAFIVDGSELMFDEVVSAEPEIVIFPIISL